MITHTLRSGIVLEGVRLLPHEMKLDRRGSFTEVFQKSWDLSFDPVQWSVVQSAPQVFRGMHFHLRHDEYFSLLSGSCVVGLKDLRPESMTYLATSLYHLAGNEISSIFFPKGILHGWYFFEDSVHLQGVSESFAQYGEDDNFGCSWQDPDLGIKWPFQEAVISSRAAGFGSLSELQRHILPLAKTI